MRVRYAALRSVCARLESEVEAVKAEREQAEAERLHVEEERQQDRRLVQLLTAQLSDCQAQLEQWRRREGQWQEERAALKEAGQRLRAELSQRTVDQQVLQAEADAAAAALLHEKRRLLSTVTRAAAEKRAVQQRLADLTAAADGWSQELQSREEEREQLLQQLQLSKDIAQRERETIRSLQAASLNKEGHASTRHPAHTPSSPAPPPPPALPPFPSSAPLSSTPPPSPPPRFSSLLSPASMVSRVQESPFATPAALPSPSAPLDDVDPAESLLLSSSPLPPPSPSAPSSVEETDAAAEAQPADTAAAASPVSIEKSSALEEEKTEEKGEEDERQAATTVTAPTAVQLRDELHFPPLISPKASPPATGDRGGPSRRHQLTDEGRQQQRKGKRRRRAEQKQTAAVDSAEASTSEIASPAPLQLPSDSPAPLSVEAALAVALIEASPTAQPALGQSTAVDEEEEGRSPLPVVRSLAFALREEDEEGAGFPVDDIPQALEPPAAPSDGPLPTGAAPLQRSASRTSTPPPIVHSPVRSPSPSAPSGERLPSRPHRPSPPPPDSLPLSLPPEPMTPTPHASQSEDAEESQTLSASSYAVSCSSAFPGSSLRAVAATPRSSALRSLAVLDSEFRRVRRWTEQMREEMRKQPPTSTPTPARARSHSLSADTPYLPSSATASRHRGRSLSGSSPSAAALQLPAAFTPLRPALPFPSSSSSSSPLSTAGLLTSLSACREELSWRCVALQSASEHARSVEDKMRSLMESYEALELRTEQLEEQHRDKAEQAERRARAEMEDAQGHWELERGQMRRAVEELQAELESSQQAMLDATIRLHELQADARSLHLRLHQQAEDARLQVEAAEREAVASHHRWQQQRLNHLRVQGQSAIDIVVDEAPAEQPLLDAQPLEKVDAACSLASLTDSLALSCDGLEQRLQQRYSLPARPSDEPLCSLRQEGEAQLWAEMRELQALVHDWRIEP